MRSSVLERSEECGRGVLRSSGNLSEGGLPLSGDISQPGESRAHRKCGRICVDTFVIAPFYYQNLVGVIAPQKQPNGAVGWALPLDPDRRVIHMGDITELGRIVVGAFARPELAGHGEYLALVGEFLSFNEIIAILNRPGNTFSFKQVPREVFAGWFPAPRASRRCSPTSKRTPIWARIPPGQSCSPTKSPASSRRSLPYGPGLTSRPRPSPEESLAAVKAGRFRPHCEAKGGAIFSAIGTPKMLTLTKETV
jgi:hypothetical protein